MTNPLIVVVEDSPTQSQAIGFYLNQYGIDVLIREDGPQGIAAIQEYQPIAVILDVNLPTMNGFQIARHLKRHPSTSHIPVIMLTRLEDTDHMVAGLNSGADYYIRKGPAAEEEIWKTLCGFGIIDWSRR
ncbi:MAG: response regulator [Chloroflexi bacterium]|nr:response regulator [Chloroflexota bacterium]MCC6895063.1 response regulator [Anaerolineae bacterium]